MPNKTDRIVNYLPSTFLKRPRGTTLHAVLDPFGRELQEAENSLAAVMQAHWVDYADRLALKIKDLAAIAALYGLAPRPDEGVEEFREHLKRYVRTYLEGTVTVQGLLRISAEALGLHILDDYADLDTWWRRDDDRVTLEEPAGKDAAQMVLGLRAARSTGGSATSARVQGTADLTGGVDLRENHILRLEIDGAGPFEIDLVDGVEDPSAVTGEVIVEKINAEVGSPVAYYDGRYLILTSALTGPTSVIEVQDILSDAAEAVLGLPPRAYSGREPEAAQIRGLVDLSGVLDLSESRYLRLFLDGAQLAEIDVAGPDEAHTLLNQVVEKINTALGAEIVITDGRFLILTSPTIGLTSSIVFQRAAAQQALARLFGPVSNTQIGRGPRQAHVTGRRDLSGGVDLSKRSRIQLRVDGVESPVIDLAGEDPTNTQLPELVAAINERVGAAIATHDGRFVLLTSPSTGLASEIVFLVLEEPGTEATDLVFGIGPRVFRGRAASPAGITGTADLSQGVDLLARHLLQVRLDGSPPVTIDLRSHASNIRAATPRQLADAIDAALGADVGATDGTHLILVSATEGSASSLEVLPMSEQSEARFVTRALITDEAAQAVFGFTRRTAVGSDAQRARIVGGVDLQRGVDLREQRYLRLVIDDGQPRDMDVAGVRPRATLLDEIVSNINNGLGINPPIASHNGRRLVLVSNTEGVTSRIRFEPPRLPDALPLLLDVPPGRYRGQNAEQVRFTGTADLSAGVDLSAGDLVRVGLDGADPVDIHMAANAANPAGATLNEVVIAFNLQIGRNVARHDGKYIQINSPTVGAGSRLVFEAPAEGDATQTVFGIAAPREYHGRDATPAQVRGQVDLSGGSDLRVIRFLRLGVDGRLPQDVDCLLPGAADPAAVTLDEIVAAINDALDAKVASHDDHILILTSPSLGEAGRIDLEPHSSGDARTLLFGSVPDETTGQDPQPAVITGEVDLLQPADFSQRSFIRLAVEGAPPVDISLKGSSPVSTTLDEIIDALNAEFPELASATEDDRLVLTSPGRGAASRLELLPLRTIDLIEYPPESVSALTRALRHRERWWFDNRGAAPAYLTASLRAPHGVSGPALVNETVGWRLRLMVGLAANEEARIWVDDGRLRATILSAAGVERVIHGEHILVGPLGSQAFVPFPGAWLLSGDEDQPPALQLNDPQARYIVRLVARSAQTEQGEIRVAVQEAIIIPVEVDPVAQDGLEASLQGRVQTSQIDGGVPSFHLDDADGNRLADLRAGLVDDLGAFADRVVVVTGTIHPQEGAPLLVVRQVENLYRVRLEYTPEQGDPLSEEYPSVTIGHDPAAHASLHYQIQTRPSALVRIESLPKSEVLRQPVGRSMWRFLDCYGPRFNFARFDRAEFPGGVCLDRGVFNISRFNLSPPEMERAVFTSINDLPDPPVTVRFEMLRYRPGAFEIRLPADLPERFGGRFNQARLGQGLANPQVFSQAVTEPPGDDAYIVELINRNSPLVEAQIVPRVPLGFTPVSLPFRQPRYLTLGSENRQAEIYLQEEGLPGFLRLQARHRGDHGNRIAVAARASGPAMYDFSVIYEGVPFEIARQFVMGKALDVLTSQSLEPGPAGVLQAKSAGIHARVVRERTPEVEAL